MTDDPRLPTVAALVARAPEVFDVVFSEDMGFECSILTDRGVIFGNPGMLLDFSGGEWPFHEEMNRNEAIVTLTELTTFFESEITPFANIKLEILEHILSTIAQDEASQ